MTGKHQRTWRRDALVRAIAKADPEVSAGEYDPVGAEAAHAAALARYEANPDDPAALDTLELAAHRIDMDPVRVADREARARWEGELEAGHACASGDHSMDADHGISHDYEPEPEAG